MTWLALAPDGSPFASRRPRDRPARRRWRAAALAWALAGLPGCQSLTLVTENQQLEVELRGLSADLSASSPAPGPAPAPAPILAGSEPCLAMLSWRLDPNDAWSSNGQAGALRACFDLAVSGPATLGPAPDACVQLEGPGQVEVSLTPRPECELDDEPVSFAPDTLRLQAVAQTEVQLRGRLFPELLATRRLAEEDDLVRLGSLPPTWGELPQILRVPDGGGVSVAVGAFMADDPSAAVHHDPDALVVSTDVTSRRPRVTNAGQGVLTLQLADGEQATTFARLGEAPAAAVVTLEGVPPCQAASLELVAVASQGEDPGELAPIFLQAIVRDEKGERLHGAPVEWSDATGSLSFPPWWPEGAAPNQPSGDQLLFVDALFPEVDEPTPRTVEIVARYCELEDALTFSWTQTPHTDLPDDPPGPPPGGSTGDTGTGAPGEDGSGSGCACATGRRRPLDARLLLLLLLGLRRRPRRAITRTGSGR